MQRLSIKARQELRTARAVGIALLGLAGLGSGCEKEAPKEAPAAAPAPSAPAAPAATAAKARPAAPAPTTKRLEWDDPKEWKRVTPESSMRLASYWIPPVKGEKEIAELNVFVLGGDVESNIRRWVDEFSGYDPKTLGRADRSVNDMSQSVVEVPKGRFSGGMNSDVPGENFGLLGAIVTTPEDVKYFFKLTGPSGTVKAARGPFYRLLDSVRLEGGVAAPGSVKVTSTTGAIAPPDPATAPASGAAPAAPSAPPAKH